MADVRMWLGKFLSIYLDTRESVFQKTQVNQKKIDDNGSVTWNVNNMCVHSGKSNAMYQHSHSCTAEYLLDDNKEVPDGLVIIDRWLTLLRGQTIEQRIELNNEYWDLLKLSIFSLIMYVYEELLSKVGDNYWAFPDVEFDLNSRDTQESVHPVNYYKTIKDTVNVYNSVLQLNVEC